jgi:hypothetical protein
MYGQSQRDETICACVVVLEIRRLLRHGEEKNEKKPFALLSPPPFCCLLLRASFYTFLMAAG